MRSNFKSSISSRATVRSLIVACLPSAALAVAANSLALGAAFNSDANHDLTVDGNSGAITNGPITKAPGTNSPTSTNGDKPYILAGIRG